MIYRTYIKHIFDWLVAFSLGILLFPFFICIVLLLLITQGKEVFFTQMRSGKNLEEFRLYKFRTLQPSYSDDLSISNRQYTFVGKFMRSFGIDELPQLLNILKGNMSFIGPRPMPVEYVGEYNEQQLARFDVKPGITGWAQVHGRNKISWISRFELDFWYIHHISLSVDLKICWLTLIQLINSIFGYYKKEPAMQVFKRSNAT